MAQEPPKAPPLNEPAPALAESQEIHMTSMIRWTRFAVCSNKKLLVIMASLLGARTLLGAPGLITSNKKLLVGNGDAVDVELRWWIQTVLVHVKPQNAAAAEVKSESHLEPCCLQTILPCRSKEATSNKGHRYKEQGRYERSSWHY